MCGLEGIQCMYRKGLVIYVGKSKLGSIGHILYSMDFCFEEFHVTGKKHQNLFYFLKFIFYVRLLSVLLGHSVFPSPPQRPTHYTLE